MKQKHGTARRQTTHAVASREEWLKARLALLAREKELTHAHDALAAERRALPWMRVEKSYRFEGADEKRTLPELFGEKSQLLVYHFMFGPDWKEGCPSCSFVGDHLDGMLAHLAQRDVAFTAVSRAPYARIAPFRKRMGWRFPWVSSHGSDFNPDFHVAPTEEERAAGRMNYNYTSGPTAVDELHGISVFARDEAGAVFHTYSTYARGAEFALGTYAWLDLVPKGRDEEGLEFTMAWVRHHDRYAAAPA